MDAPPKGQVHDCMVAVIMAIMMAVASIVGSLAGAFVIKSYFRAESMRPIAVAEEDEAHMRI